MRRDLPFGVVLAPGSSLVDHTGDWRAERPQYVRRPAPCAAACPAAEDPRGWLEHLARGEERAAWEAIVATNPFPAVSGRVCWHPCESGCHRGSVDEAIAINAAERHLGDAALAAGWPLPATAPPTGRRVLVVGGGPAGLTAAEHLRRLGHAVEVHDAGKAPGGMLRYGIPAYRLPRLVLHREIERLEDAGVTVHRDSRVEDVEAARAEGRFDAVFVALGADVATRLEVPATDGARLLDAVGYLHDAASGSGPRLGRRVAVYGGGDTAVDAARTARRLGADEAVVVYRRAPARMSAHAAEVLEAVEEGIAFRWLSVLDHVDGRHVAVERVEAGPDGDLRPTGEVEELAADAVVLAVGQHSDLTPLASSHGVTAHEGRIDVDAAGRTGAADLFGGGDVVRGERSVATAIGHGRRGALGIDAHLRGAPPPRPAARAPVPFTDLELTHARPGRRAHRPHADAATRTAGFDEVVGALTADAAVAEAARCLCCGSCAACDACFVVCPDDAVLKLADGEPYAYEIDLDHCKGCGLCVAECPVGAMQLLPEPLSPPAEGP